MQKIFISLLLLAMLSGCSIFAGSNADRNPNSYQPIDIQDILELLCDSDTNCIAQQCPDPATCPLMIALSHPVIFDFISSISPCAGCNTPTFSPDVGIGECVEYTVQKLDENHEVELRVSENCKFRYAQPTETRITVLVNTENGTIEHISPPKEFIDNPTYCQEKSDCRCLSGSGVELIGCSNFFHAPLNLAGYYEGEACGCVDGECKKIGEE